MTYYILPQNKIKLQIIPTFKDPGQITENLISHSVNYYSDLILMQIKKLHKDDLINLFNQAVSFVNPYQFIFSKIPTYKFAVSKMHFCSNDVYELIELSNVCNIFENFKYKTNINIYHIGYTNPSMELINLLRNNIDNNVCESNINSIIHGLLYSIADDNIITDSNCDCKYEFDMMFFNIDFNNSLQNYFQKALYILFIILNIQKTNGVSIIKINHLHDKLLIEIIYILNTLYNKVYIIKPNCSSIIENARYIVCKNYFKCENNSENIILLKELLKNANNINIESLLNIHIPYYFLNKIEEINVIIGQQQLECFFQIINILKNKNKEEKFETLKRNNILKCIQWCEKFHVPYNKILEKNNMFSFPKNIKNVFNGKQLYDNTNDDDTNDDNTNNDDTNNDDTNNEDTNDDNNLSKSI